VIIPTEQQTRSVDLGVGVALYVWGVKLTNREVVVVRILFVAH